MFSAAMHLLQIKDLKDLSVFFGWGYYRHAGPKGPEEIFLRERSRGKPSRMRVWHARAPALRLVRRPRSRPVRDQAIPNYSLLLL